MFHLKIMTMNSFTYPVLSYFSAFSTWFYWFMCNVALKYSELAPVCWETWITLIFEIPLNYIMIQLLSLSFLPSVLLRGSSILRPTSVTLSIYSSEILDHYLWPGWQERLHSFTGNLTEALKRTQNLINKEGAQLLLIQFPIFGWPTAMRGLVAISLSCTTLILAK